MRYKQYIMKSLEQYRKLLYNFQKEKGSFYGIQHLGIFGSVARNQQTPNSDIDIFYTGEPLSLFQLAALKQELEEILKIRVDIVRMRESMNRLLKKRIQKEGFNVG